MSQAKKYSPKFPRFPSFLSFGGYSTYRRTIVADLYEGNDFALRSFTNSYFYYLVGV